MVANKETKKDEGVFCWRLAVREGEVAEVARSAIAVASDFKFPKESRIVNDGRSVVPASSLTMMEKIFENREKGEEEPSRADSEQARADVGPGVTSSE